MAKIFIADLAKVLVEKHGVSMSTAQLFLDSIVECIQDGLSDDGFAKIKGLGTFKLVGVDARESIDVNSGERRLIDSHQKVSFVPDNSMKELVNKPFAHFETVVLNDGIDTDTLARAAEIAAKQENLDPDTTDEPETEPAGNGDNEEQQANNSDEVTMATPIDDVTPAPEASPAAEATPTDGDTTVDAVEVSPEKTEADDNNKAEDNTVESVDDMAGTVPYSGDEDYFKDEQSKDEKKTSYWWAWLLLAIAACVASFAGGYILGSQKSPVVKEIEAVPLVDTVKADADSVGLHKTQDSHKAQEPQKSQKPQNVQEPSKAQEPQKEQEPSKVQEPQKEPVPHKPQEANKPQESQPTQPSGQTASGWQKYDKMDSRLRNGAYGIVGTDRVLSVRKGQTLTSITKSTLGRGMECYIEVYNGLKPSENVKVGQKIKIPKVVLKKKLRKNK